MSRTCKVWALWNVVLEYKNKHRLVIDMSFNFIFFKCLDVFLIRPEINLAV